jgi:hypothetical protein
MMLMLRLSYIVDLERCEDWRDSERTLEFNDYCYAFWGLTRRNNDRVMEW